MIFFLNVRFCSIATRTPKTTEGSGSSGNGEDHKEYNLFASVAKKVAGKTTLSMNYNNLRHQATVNSDYKRNDFSLAGEYLATKRLTFDGELGRHWFNFNSISNSNDGFGHVTGSYFLTRNKTLDLGYSVVASGVSGFQNIAPRDQKSQRDRWLMRLRSLVTHRAGLQPRGGLMRLSKE